MVCLAAPTLILIKLETTSIAASNSLFDLIKSITLLKTKGTATLATVKNNLTNSWSIFIIILLS